MRVALDVTEYGEQVSLAARHTYVYEVPLEEIGITSGDEVVDPETERWRWRTYNRKWLRAFLEGTASATEAEGDCKPVARKLMICT